MANPNIADADGDTSLHAAISADCSKETLQEIIDHGVNVNAMNEQGRTPLLLGCFYRHMDSVKVLLEAGADPTITDKEGLSCLHAAIDGYCSKDILQALIDHGAHIDVTRKDGTTALLRACTGGQSESVMFLVEAGADVSITNSDGNTCLHAAVKGHSSKEALQKIMAQGMIKVNAVNNRSETALILACYTKQSKSARYLLQIGADPDVVDDSTCTSLHAAVYGYCTNETLQDIIAHEVHLNAQNARGETALWLACIYKQQDYVKILLEAGSNPNIASSGGNASLHAAVSGRCNENIISAILDHGAIVNATNKENVTALVLTCEKGNENVINLLLNSGANPNIADTNGDIWLHKAARRECCTEVFQAVLSHGVDVNATNKKNKTALVIACHKGNTDAINILLNAGADPNIPDCKGATCIHHAVIKGCSKDVLETIMNHGADVNATNKNNETALMLACEKGSKEAINVLLSAGADPSIAKADGDTGLHYAVYGDCNKEVLQSILRHGVDVNATNKKNVAALMIACHKGNTDSIDTLLNAGADLNIPDCKGAMCIHHAVVNSCSKDVLQTIVNHGSDVNATNANNVTALMLACQKGSKDAINVLLNAGADPNIAKVNGDTWLHYAAYGDCSKEVLQVIFSHGVDVNATNGKNETALMIACHKGNTDAVHTLLNAGADLNIPDCKGAMCIHHAVVNSCSKDMLEILVNHGADVNATNKKNVTALMLACEKGNKDVISVLINAGADGNTCLHYAVYGDCNKEVLQVIVKHGADVNVTDKYNQTLLMIACGKGNEETISVLLNAGADPNIVNVDGDTCLHYAAYGDCSREILQVIICQCADVDATNKYNQTLLMIACAKGNKDAINVLLNTGADPNTADTNGDRCLHYAVGNDCCTEIFQALITYGSEVNATNKTNVTALMLTCKKGNTDAINVLLNAGAIHNIVDTSGDIWLHYAARNDCCTEVLQTVISHGVDVNAANKKNVTALMIACHKGNTDAIDILLKAGADPNMTHCLGATCSHHAVCEGCSQNVLETIASHGADVNATHKNSITALMSFSE